MSLDFSLQYVRWLRSVDVELARLVEENGNLGNRIRASKEESEEGKIAMIRASREIDEEFEKKGYVWVPYETGNWDEMQLRYVTGDRVGSLNDHLLLISDLDADLDISQVGTPFNQGESADYGYSATLKGGKLNLSLRYRVEGEKGEDYLDKQSKLAQESRVLIASLPTTHLPPQVVRNVQTLKAKVEAHYG